MDISAKIVMIAIYALPFLMGAVFHEVAHGYAAYRYGDRTALMAGRLTFNPVKHLDPLGTMVFVLTALASPIVFGWAKPVPINPNRFSKFKQGLIVVSAAGSITNFLLAIAFYLIFLGIVAAIPGDATSIGTSVEFFLLVCRAGVLVNLILGILNLLPIPPLDGSKIVFALLPGKAAYKYMQIERFGLIILIVLLMSGILDSIFRPILYLVRYLTF